MRTKFGRTVIVALAVGAAAVQAAGPAVVKSAALTAETRVDGLITDWTTLSSLTKEVSVAAANDQDRLVIAIATSDASVKQRLLAAGVIVYLDPKGKKAKTFGVRIPPPRNPEGRQPAVTYVEVLGPAAKESHIVDLAARTGFEVGRDENQGTLLIEVAVPLRPSNGTAIAAPVDPALKAIGLGLVTPDVPVQGRGQPGEGGRGGGASGGRGGMSGGMGRGGGGFGGPPGGAQGPGRSQGKELKVWTSLELAPRSAPTTPGVPLP